jgi:hypothetical protein
MSRILNDTELSKWNRIKKKDENDIRRKYLRPSLTPGKDLY